jgi:hypothetical protein
MDAMVRPVVRDTLRAVPVTGLRAVPVTGHPPLSATASRQGRGSGTGRRSLGVTDADLDPVHAMNLTLNSASVSTKLHAYTQSSSHRYTEDGWADGTELGTSVRVCAPLRDVVLFDAVVLLLFL